MPGAAPPQPGGDRIIAALLLLSDATAAILLAADLLVVCGSVLLRFLFNALDHGYTGLMQAGAHPVPRMSIPALFADRRAVATIAIWMALNVVLALGAAELAQPVGIAWEAHLGGFWAGLLAFGWFDRVADPRLAG